MTQTSEAGSPRLAGIVAACAVVFAATAPWSIVASQSALIAGALAVSIGLAFRRLRLPPLPATLWCVVAFIGAQALSIPFSVHPGRSLFLLKDSWTFLFPLVFWAMLAEQRSRERALTVFTASCALVGLYGIIQHFTGRDWLRDRALENYGGGGYVAVGAYGHLSYSGVILPAFFLALGLFFERRRWAYLVAAALIGGGLLFGFARTAWVGAAVGLGVLGLLRGRRVFWGLSGGLALVTGIAVAAEPALRNRLLTLLAIGDDPRSRLWGTALRIWADHPVFGAGLGAYKTQFPIYKLPGEYMAHMHPHSDPLNHLVEAGLVGLGAWIAVWVAFFAQTGGGRSWLVAGQRAGVAAMLAAGLGQCYVTDQEPAQAWWFLVAATLWTARTVPRAAAAGPRPIGSRRRTPGRSASRRFKEWTLPLAARWFGRGRADDARLRTTGSPGPTARRRIERAPLDSDRELATRLGAGRARILLVRQDNRLGNLLLLTPFLRRLREALPASRIAFLSGEAYAPLLRSWPWVDEWIVQHKRRHAGFPPLFLPWIAGVRRERWDCAFELSNHNTHSYYNALLAVLSGAPERVGFDHPRSRPALTIAAARPAERLHFSLAPLGLLRAIGLNAPGATMSIPVPAPPSAPYAAWARAHGADGPRAILHLGGRDAKAWPSEAWEAFLPRAAAVANGPVVLVAGPEEQDRLDALVRQSGGRAVRAPVLSLTDLAHLLHGASAFVGCDSGVMHLSAALGTPTVALFFRSNPYQYAPLGSRHRTVLLADPYRVEDEEWARPQDGLARGALHRALPADAAAARSGVPETGPRALDAAEAALVAALAGQGEV